MTIENLILEAIDEGKASNVREVISLLREKFSEAEILEAIKGLEDKEKIELNNNIPAHYSFIQYLKNADCNLWLYLVFSASLATLTAIYLIPAIYPIVIARWVLGSLFILFLPGYTLIEALFPKRLESRSLDAIVRLALGIGLSLAITPLIGLLLNYTPWGIRLDPIVFSLTLFTLTMSLVAAHRKFTQSKNFHIKHTMASKRTRGYEKK